MKNKIAYVVVGILIVGIITLGILIVKNKKDNATGEKSLTGGQVLPSEGVRIDELDDVIIHDVKGGTKLPVE